MLPTECALHRDGTRLRLIGEIDRDNAAELAERLVVEIRSGIDELDLTRTTHFGAAAVRALLHGRAALATGTRLRVTCSPLVFHVLQVCGVRDLHDLDVKTSEPGR